MSYASLSQDNENDNVNKIYMQGNCFGYLSNFMKIGMYYQTNLTILLKVEPISKL